MMKLVHLLFAVTFMTIPSQISTQTLKSPCINPKGESGRCVFLRECQPLLTIYQKNVVSLEESEFFYASSCPGTFKGKPLLCCVLARSTRSSVLPKPNECGGTIRMIDRIHGGEESYLGEFPWIALLWFRHPDGGESFNCGGTLINSRYVLTAAHCLETRSNWTFSSVILGDHNITNNGPDCDRRSVCASTPVEVGFEKIIVHEGYRSLQRGKFDDIALIRLDRPVGFSDYVSPICLPIDAGVRYANNEGQEAIAAGWGITENDEVSEVLLKVSLTITNQQKCAQQYRTKFRLRTTQLCAGGGQAGKDTCLGDSGGPLMRRVGNTFYLQGIISHGPKECGTEGIAGIYTNVAQYIDWIRSKLE